MRTFVAEQDDPAAHDGCVLRDCPHEEYGVARPLVDLAGPRTPSGGYLPNRSTPLASTTPPGCRTSTFTRDVLHERTSHGPGGLPIRWSLDREKLVGLGVFVIPGLSLHYLIPVRIGRALAEAQATGYTSQCARHS